VDDAGMAHGKSKDTNGDSTRKQVVPLFENKSEGFNLFLAKAHFKS
jgi:hypothetical protein